jgi:hypothetical protein
VPRDEVVDEKVRRNGVFQLFEKAFVSRVKRLMRIRMLRF